MLDPLINKEVTRGLAGFVLHRYFVAIKECVEEHPRNNLHISFRMFVSSSAASRRPEQVYSQGVALMSEVLRIVRHAEGVVA